MNGRSKKGIRSVLMGLGLTTAIALSGCGGGGGGGGTTTTTTTDSGGSGASLRVAERISVVDASSSGAGVAGLRIGKFRVAPPQATTDSDWNKDQTQVFVHERSAEAFGIINEILCMMSQSQYDDMVNKGTYRAQIDMNQCKQDRDSAESAGQSSTNQSSSSTMPDYEDWTVNSYRADNSSPHIVKVWINEKARSEEGWSEPAKTIYVKVTITEGASAANPYGLFTLNFVGIPVGTSTPMFKGYLKSVLDGSSILLKFVDEGAGGTDTWTEQVVLDRAADGLTGKGSINTVNTWNGNTETSNFNIAFNPDYFLRDNGTEQKCADRNDFNETAWRYGLYDVNGARVNRESGFPIKYGDYHGWVGYWGLWLPDNVTINDGATVYKQVYSSNATPTETPYTLLKRGGKLKKHTRNQFPLNNITNIPLDYWEQVCTNQQDPSTCTQTGYRVKWNGSAFVKFQQMDQNTMMWTDLIPEAPINLSTIGWGELNFWSQSLGGQIRVKLVASGVWPSVTYTYPDASTAGTVIFYKEDIVYPGDTVPTNFRCYDNCPKYDATTGVTSSGWIDPNNPITIDYTFDSSVSGMLLKDDSNRALVLTSATGTNQWGFMSGPLFDPSASNLALLDCNFDMDNDPLTNTQTCGWKAWSEFPVFYTWETGPNQWNQLTLLTDTNGPVKFQAPLQVQYTHTQTDVNALDNKYNGSNFYLEYSGFGELHGIPGTCVDESGVPTNCGPNTRWIAEFMIPTGSTVTPDNGTTLYYVKPLELEQTMKLVSAATCTTAGLATNPYTLPSISDWSDPAIGTEPTTVAGGLISEAPAVIGGVVQSGF